MWIKGLCPQKGKGIKEMNDELETFLMAAAATVFIAGLSWFVISIFG